MKNPNRHKNDMEEGLSMSGCQLPPALVKKHHRFWNGHRTLAYL